MRCMNRNKVLLYYALRTGQEEIIDEYGNATGEYEITYSKPIGMLANISPAQGDVQAQMFGINISYDKVIVLDDPHTEIDEHTILWIDSTPLLGEDGNLVVNDGQVVTPNDYIVKKCAISLNSASIAISKVDVR